MTPKMTLAGSIAASLALAAALLVTPASDAEAPVTSVATSAVAEVVDLGVASVEGEETFDVSALDDIESTARFSVAVMDVEGGDVLTYGDADMFDTASIVKVDILAALLADQGGALTSSQLEQATAMIVTSDNTAATALFAEVGGVDGLTAFNDDLGLTDTVVADSWGLTQTTPADQLLVLQAALEHPVAAELMGDVIDAQRFGVSAAADDAQETALKVGYLQRSTTGLWDVTSIGRVEVDGQEYLVAVLTDGNVTFDDGVALAEAVARAAVPSSATAV